MKNHFKNFVRNIAILTMALAVIALAMYYLAPKKYLTPTLPYQIVFFLVITLGLHYFLLNSAENKKKVKFISSFMLVTTVKLLGFLAIILIYAFQAPHDAVTFLITFFILYMLYTIFEIISILKFIKPGSSEEKSKGG